MGTGQQSGDVQNSSFAPGQRESRDLKPGVERGPQAEAATDQSYPRRRPGGADYDVRKSLADRIREREAE